MITTIVADLDGTLILSDSLYEATLRVARSNPVALVRAIFSLGKGKAAFKASIARAAYLDPASLPYHNELLDWLREKKSSGCRIVLCSAADMRHASAIADHLGVFDEVHASDGNNNLSGAAKRQLLDRLYGPANYLYIGDHRKDLAVWQGAGAAAVVGNDSALVEKVRRLVPLERHFSVPAATIRDWFHVFRFHQYVKNALLFVPLIAAHRLTDVNAIQTLVVAFTAFGLCASSVYILNDLLDLPNDRVHPTKRRRPFASGAIPVVTGLFLMPASLSVSVVLAVQVGWGFCAALAGYFVLTCAYSFRLKELVLVDCMTLTALYTARLVSGAIAVSVPLSFWLLAFSIFIFLSLAFVKRYAELHVQTAAGKTDIAGRGYVGSDASVIQMLGTASGYSAVMVLALYINSSAVVRLYSLPQALWFCIPLVIYWISRMWVKTHRGEMLDDPVLFAIRDRTSLLVLALLALSFLCAAAGRPVLEPWLELLGLQRQ